MYDWIEDISCVQQFLESTKKILRTHELSTCFALLRSSPRTTFDNSITLHELQLSLLDVCNELQRLTAAHYCKTTTDLNDENSPPYWIFETVIARRSIYIKYKLLQKPKPFILCMSFHYAKFPLYKKPYPLYEKVGVAYEQATLSDL